MTDALHDAALFVEDNNEIDLNIGGIRSYPYTARRRVSPADVKPQLDLVEGAFLQIFLRCQAQGRSGHFLKQKVSSSSLASSSSFSSAALGD